MTDRRTLANDPEVLVQFLTSGATWLVVWGDRLTEETLERYMYRCFAIYGDLGEYGVFIVAMPYGSTSTIVQEQRDRLSSGLYASEAFGTEGKYTPAEVYARAHKRAEEQAIIVSERQWKTRA